MSTEAPVRATQMIGRYHVLGEVGRGGMGIVYRAEDRLIGRQVAIKTLTEVTPELRERFYIEARSGILSHQNIVTVYELGEHESSPFIAMEFIDGDSLEQVLRERKRLPLLEGLAIVEQLCAGLGYAHGHGVVHRDVKPANVLVRPDGRVTIVDFGIARLADQTRQLTKTDTLLGTVHYIAPERLKGDLSDGRADVWSVGVMLYEMLTGQLPFKGSDISSLYRVIHEPYVPLAEHVQDMPEGLSQVLDRALAKQVDDRYATAEEMAFDLQMLGEGLKHDRVATLLDTARRLTGERQFVSARTVLLQAQRIDPSNTDTKALLGEVQEQLSHTQRGEQVRQMVEQAQGASQDRRWDDAVVLLEQARKLDSKNLYNLTEQLDLAQKGAARAQAVQEAHTALDAGKNPEALEIVEQAVAQHGASDKLEQVRQIAGEKQEATEEILALAADEEAENALGHTRHLPLAANRIEEAATPAAMTETSESAASTQHVELSKQTQPFRTVQAQKGPDEKPAANEADAGRSAAIEESIQAAVALCERAVEAGEFDRCLRPLDEVAKQHGQNAELVKARKACEAKRARKAGQMLEDAVASGGMLLAKGSVAEAESALNRANHAAAFVDAAARRKWEGLKKKCVSTREAQQRAQSRKTPGAKTRSGSGTTRWALGGAAVAVLGGAVLSVGLLHGRHQAPAAQAPTPHVSAPAPKVAPAVSLVDVEINASPWAKVLSVNDAAGNAVTMPTGEQTTPLRIEGVKPGSYKVLLQRQDGQQQTADCTITAENHLCTASLQTLDTTQLLKGEQP